MRRVGKGRVAGGDDVGCADGTWNRRAHMGVGVEGTSMLVFGGGLAHDDGGGNQDGTRKGRKAQRWELAGVRGWMADGGSRE